MVHKERLILLAKTKYGEADLILKAISATGDVYSVIAKSALRSKKRFGGGILEPTHYLHATIEKKSSDFDNEKLFVITEAQIIDDFRGLKTDYDRLTLAFHFVRTVSTVAREGDLHREIFNLLGHALKAAETTDHLSLLKLRFDLKLLHLQGVLPHEERFYPYLRPAIREEFSAEHLQLFENHVRLRDEVAHLFANYIL